MRSSPVFFAVALLASCSSKNESGSQQQLPAVDTTCSGPCPQSQIKHVVIVVQENHTFDSSFGRYCAAVPGSNPTCNDGPRCCEAGPPSDPAGNAAIVLTDDVHAGRDPDHSAKCETEEMNGGKMDRYVSASCGSPQNVAYADATTVKPYWDLAATGAIADRYFQPIIGQSSANDMYLARAGFVFNDNDQGPKDAIGIGCSTDGPPAEYTDKTIGDLLDGANVPWAFYAEGYKAMTDAVAAGSCPTRPHECAFPLPLYPCVYDPADVPFQYYPSIREKHMKDFGAFEGDLANGTLPAVSYVKAIGYRSEHPGHGTTLSAGVAFAAGVVDAVSKSRYREDTLVLITYDEGGGFFDHVAPPPTSAVDGKPYGTRVPLIAAGPFAKKNFVSHVTMEHSSIVKFVEWNWLGATGQLKTRDTEVANIGSLLDAMTTGAAVPEN